MSNIVENGVVHDEHDCTEITQNSPTAIDPQDTPGTHLQQLVTYPRDHHSSEDSLDSVGDKVPSEQILLRKRNNFKCRSISDSDSGSISFPRSILKGGKNRFRSFSESSAEIYQLSSYGDSNPVLDEWPNDEEQEQDGGFVDETDCDKVKKTVRFNDTVRQQLFRSTSSILGQRKKNQRKQQRKAKKSRKEDATQLSSSAESDHPEVEPTFIQCVVDSLDQVTLTEDSGVDVEDSDPSSAPVNANSNRSTKKSKKHKKGKNQRRRNISEPPLGCNDMMFDLDL